ncbi:hypothetical protein KUTeg_012100 [Tegillarca granosa]|uniref:Uncharacterized protein n=1 Tax=Tegillarca granosa TaxID=220873 RepID=A0ABQ9EYK4_TEGGR|nr:hypothetical protein KUTeg_012100 [Tegillarca granosa]
MSSSRSSDHMPKLKSANFESLGQDVEVNYKSGAMFKGKVQDHKRSGTGIFTWPNGAKYEGQYSDNLRNGKGLQVWQDGSKYNGDFESDMRHGEGELSWSNGEVYKGTFFRDRRHGKGVYTWPNGSTYTGTFYMDRKEGYGLFKFANGNTFEGLYKDDEREGPGVLTYTDGKQDVGLWHGEKLIKLCTSSPNAFMMEDHQEFDYNPDEHIEYIKAEPEEVVIPEFVESPEIFDYLPENNVMETVMNLYSDSLDPRSLAINKDIFDQEFFKGSEREKDDKAEKIKAWNKTPSMIDIQRHVHKHRHQQKNMSFNIDKIIKGDRTKFKQKGPLETASEELIEAATNGDEKVVEDLLTAGNVHPDVADKDGHTPLIGATVNWHIGVINCLLNHGADVNKLNDEGCSALSAGAIFFYPVDSFLFNIAERYLDVPSASKKSKKDGKQTGKKSDDKSENKQKTKSGGRDSPSQKQKTDKKLKVPPGVSTTSVDSGFYQSDSNQSIGAPQGKLQVRIKEPVEGEATLNEKEEELDSVLGEQKNEEDVEFDSTATLHDFEIEVTEQLIERCATQLSTNEKIVKGRRSHNSADLGTVRHLAVIKNEKERMKQTLDLLLKRGADPNASNVPMPVLFFAIKSADVEVVKKLLLKGASTAITLPKEKGGLAPLHIACAIPGEEGVQITELLLNALADPDVRATEDDSFLNRTLFPDTLNIIDKLKNTENVEIKIYQLI